MNYGESVDMVESCQLRVKSTLKRQGVLMMFTQQPSSNKVCISPKNNRNNHSKRQKERGSVAVEVAFAFPMILVVFMVMMFLMDVMMVKQEITNVGFTAMRECSGVPNTEQCVLSLISSSQELRGSNGRYSCDAVRVNPIVGPGTEFQVIQLECEYQGYLPLNSVLDIIDVDLSDFTEFKVPIFFPASNNNI